MYPDVGLVISEVKCSNLKPGQQVEKSFILMKFRYPYKLCLSSYRINGNETKCQLSNRIIPNKAGFNQMHVISTFLTLKKTKLTFIKRAHVHRKYNEKDIS